MSRAAHASDSMPCSTLHATRSTCRRRRCRRRRRFIRTGEVEPGEVGATLFRAAGLDRHRPPSSGWQKTTAVRHAWLRRRPYRRVHCVAARARLAPAHARLPASRPGRVRAEAVRILHPGLRFGRVQLRNTTQANVQFTDAWLTNRALQSGLRPAAQSALPATCAARLRRPQCCEAGPRAA